MKYYMATRNVAMMFFPHGMKSIHHGELLTAAELRRYGIDPDAHYLRKVEISSADTYKARFADSRRAVRFA